MSSITTVNNGDTGLTARSSINSNFANLNSDKLEAADIANLPHSGLNLDDNFDREARAAMAYEPMLCAGIFLGRS